MTNTIISLNGEWKISYTNPGEGWHFEKEIEPDVPFYSATVPGYVQLDFLKQGIIADPYWGDNAKSISWMNHKEWWYRKNFNIEKQTGDTYLHFKGLDTFASIYLNGQFIGRHEDMHFPLILNVTDILRYNHENALVVRLGSYNFESIRRSGEVKAVWNSLYDRLYNRKTEMGIGWDWSPEIIPTGIWRDIYLENVPHLKIHDPHFRTLDSDSKIAKLEFSHALDVIDNKLGTVVQQLTLSYIGKTIFSKEINTTLHPETERYNVNFSIKNPHLWFPHNVGIPHLYDLKLQVYNKDKSILLDSLSLKVGIRTVELVTDSKGESLNNKVFYFKINGQKVFLKGANWVPPDLFFTRTGPSKYDQLLHLAKDANMNTLRVWGGGIIEDDYFYKRCDELGILIWHDFLFACGEYPEDDAFLTLASAECYYIITHLRNHPSLFFWSGNNENEMLVLQRRDEVPHHPLFDRILPDLIRHLDPDRAYISSSPTLGDSPNSFEEGDAHNWSMWHLLQGIQLEKDTSRFLSEFGMQALPHMDSLKAFIPPDHLHQISEMHIYRKLQPHRLFYLMYPYGIPSDMHKTILYSQLSQAETLRQYIEHH